MKFSIEEDGYVGPPRSDLNETTAKLYVKFDLSPLYDAQENAVKAKLRELGWVQLKPGQVVAEWKCRYANSLIGNHRVVNGHCESCGMETELVEVKQE